MTTDDPEIVAHAILLSGSYMLYDKHVVRPDLTYFEKNKKKYP